MSDKNPWYFYPAAIAIGVAGFAISAASMSVLMPVMMVLAVFAGIASIFQKKPPKK